MKGRKGKKGTEGKERRNQYEELGKGEVVVGR